MGRVGLVGRVLDLVAPRQCAICGARLAPGEELLCVGCNLRLPRTDHLAHPYDNEMAKVFWGRVRAIEKAAALVYHQSGSQASWPIYDLKYYRQAEVGEVLGRMLAEEMMAAGDFLGDIDVLVPVPLSRGRRRERGYNQSELIARGMARACGKPVATDVLERREYLGSQTTMGRWQRNENVANAFRLRRGDRVRGCHVLLVDDIVTTGATVCACARQLEPVEGVRISVAAIGFVDPRR